MMPVIAPPRLFEGYLDSFDAGTWAQWEPMGATPAPDVFAGYAQAGSPVSGTPRTGYWKLHRGRFMTDCWRIIVWFRAPNPDSFSGNNSGVMGNIPDSGPAAGGTEVIATAVYTAQAQLVSQSGALAAPYATSGQTGQTVRGTTPNSTARTDALILDRILDTFYLYHFRANTQLSVVSWNAGAGTPKDRRWGIFMEAAKANQFSSISRAYGIDQVQAYDLQV